MAGRLPSPDSADDARADTGAGTDREPTTSRPRWVYAFAIIAVVVVLLFVILHLAGGGPGRHAAP